MRQLDVLRNEKASYIFLGYLYANYIISYKLDKFYDFVKKKEESDLVKRNVKTISLKDIYFLYKSKNVRDYVRLSLENENAIYIIAENKNFLDRPIEDIIVHSTIWHKHTKVDIDKNSIRAWLIKNRLSDNLYPYSLNLADYYTQTNLEKDIKSIELNYTEEFNKAKEQCLSLLLQKILVNGNTEQDLLGYIEKIKAGR